MNQNLEKAQKFWNLAIQYLHLSESVASEIASSGNHWLVVKDTTDDITDEDTKWTDYNLGVPVIFNFYHGIELLLKGFWVCDGETKLDHNLSKLLMHVDEEQNGQRFLEVLKGYIDGSNPLLQGFFSDSGVDIDQWYIAFRYPESMNGNEYSHFKLKYQEEIGADFFAKLSEDISEIRKSSVSYIRGKYQI
jgi:hypothetical protein